MTSNIPAELKRLPQWVCFDIEGDKKVPYTPGTDSRASSNRPAEWRSFNAAMRDVESGKRQHLGFCFSSSDPYVFIDLDDPEDEVQKKIFKRFRSYSQRSISGNGIHIIARGTFQGRGKHPAKPAMGLFKDCRFALMTGDTIKGRKEIREIAEEDLQALHGYLGNGSSSGEVADLVEYEAELPDQTVIDMGEDRFDKFLALCNGQWEQFEEYGGDHSVADHAFIAMLCDLTDCNEQVRRLFSYSSMWNEERAAKKAGHGLVKYVDRTVAKIRANQERERKKMAKFNLNFDEDEPPVIEVREERKPIVPDSGDKTLIESLPDGIIKDIARYSYRTSFYPLQEASLCSSIALFSGITGRGYLTHTYSGLNLWVILVGGTSCGKDEFQAAMGRITGQLEKRGMGSVSKLLGGELVSGPAMEQVFQDRKRYIAYLPEFGDLFKMWANPQAPDHVRSLNRYLLNCYNSANAHGSIKARRRAQGVEGVESIERPCLVLAGEATPESLYGSMTQRELSTGFLQRFLLVNVPRESWSLIENKDAGKSPSKDLLDRMEQLILHVDAMETDSRKGRDHVVVPCRAEALELLHEYRVDKRKEIMDCPDGIARKEVINRAGLKALRLATLFAVGADFYDPEVTVEHAEAAVRFVERCDKELIQKFTTGEVGAGQVKQEAEIVKAAVRIRELPIKARMALGMGKKVAREKSMLPLSILKSEVVNSQAFSGDKFGAVSAFEKCIDSLVRSGTFVKIKEDIAIDTFDHIKGVLLGFRE